MTIPLQKAGKFPPSRPDPLDPGSLAAPSEN